MAISEEEPIRKTLVQWRKEAEGYKLELEKVKNGSYCYMCDSFKTRDKFYKSTDPKISNGLCPICRQCAYDIAERLDKYGERHEPTRDSLIEALKYMNKPFIEALYTNAIKSASVDSGTNGKRNNFARTYFSMMQGDMYSGMTFMNSDFFKKNVTFKENPFKSQNDDIDNKENQEEYAQWIKDRDDTIKILGYDCFANEKIEDKPYLYSQFLGLTDSSEDSTDDIIKLNSIVSICRSFLQMNKIDDTIATMMLSVVDIGQNSADIASLQNTKQKIQSNITNLASESCISLKNNRNVKKGDNTWTGKISKIKDLNLLDGNVNGFDVGTCKGMQQVADISMSAIVKALHLDESDYTDMISEQREMIADLNLKSESYREAARILLKENIDLRQELEDNGVNIRNSLLDLEDIVNTYIESTNAKLEDN